MKPGLKTLIAGVLLCLGAFVVPVLSVLPIIFGKSDEIQFNVPGKQEFTATDTGRYYLWNDYRTVYHGKSYDLPENIPGGMDIRIRDTNGSELQFVNDASTSVNSGTDSKKSIGYVQVDQPGKLEIEVSGGAENRVFSFAKSRLLKIAGLVLGGMALSVLIVILGIGLIVWGIVKLVRSSTA
jgi:hypothetical protein